MIYCVEDERNIRELIVYTLESSGFTARGLESGKELNAAIAEQLPDLILLDIMLPGEDGLEILSRLKASEVTKEIPVIMVTAKGAEYDKVMGLDCGADDYITKPFGMMEFIARVRAVLRRAGKEEKENDVLETGDLQIQVKQHQVLAKGEKVTLTLKEFELLKFLMENKGIVLTRDRLLGHVWGYDFDGETRTVDVHVRTLRVGQGLPFWLPNGATIRRVLERYIVDKEVAAGYQHVYTPPIASVELYKTSGHWDHYREDMFPTMDMGDGEAFVLLHCKKLNKSSHPNITIFFICFEITIIFLYLFIIILQYNFIFIIK